MVSPSSILQERASSSYLVPPSFESCFLTSSSVRLLFRAASGTTPVISPEIFPEENFSTVGISDFSSNSKDIPPLFRSSLYIAASCGRTLSADITSSLRLWPNISLPVFPVRYPSVKPLRENTASRRRISSQISPLLSTASRRAVTAAATYSGRFIRPSILNDAQPAFISSSVWLTRDISFSDRA